LENQNNGIRLNPRFK